MYICFVFQPTTLDCLTLSPCLLLGRVGPTRYLPDVGGSGFARSFLKHLRICSVYELIEPQITISIMSIFLEKKKIKKLKKSTLIQLSW